MGACCGGGVPDVILPDPNSGQKHTFIVQKAGIMSRHYDVMNEHKQRWLYIRNESSFWDTKSKFELENFIRTDGQGQTLASCKVEGAEPEFSKIKETVEDSDGEFCIDDSDDEEDTEYKVKMKWKMRREAHYTDAQGNKVAKLKIKMKGKSKAELEVWEDDQGHEHRSLKSDTKVKKVDYKLTIGDNEVDLDYKNNEWHIGDRTWKCDQFKVFYDEKFGRDSATIDTFENSNTPVCLLIAFTMGFFFHPKYLSEKMDGYARNAAHNLANLHQ